MGAGVVKHKDNSSGKSKDAEQATAEASFDPVAGKSVAEIFGEIVWLMSQDNDARELQVKDLEWLVMPPILLKQFHITYAPVPTGRTLKGEPVRVDDTVKGASSAASKPLLQPVAVELFAMCSDAMAATLDSAADSGKLALAMNDWRSGPNRRVVRLFGLKRAEKRGSSTIPSANDVKPKE